MTNKRSLIKAAAVALAACSLAGSAPAEDRDVALQLAWLPNVSSAGEIIALKKGFFEEAGLNVTILPGGPSANTIQEVLGRTADIAVAYAPQIMYAADKGLPIKSLGRPSRKLR